MEIRGVEANHYFLSTSVSCRLYTLGTGGLTFLTHHIPSQETRESREGEITGRRGGETGGRGGPGPPDGGFREESPCVDYK